MITQIYEIQTPFEAERCIKSGVDHIGSVLLSQEEWEQPEIKKVVQLCKDSSSKSSIIPLFKDLDTLRRMLAFYEPDFIHFCDTLTDDNGENIELAPFLSLQQEIKKSFPDIQIIRSIPMFSVLQVPIIP